MTRLGQNLVTLTTLLGIWFGAPGTGHADDSTTIAALPRTELRLGVGGSLRASTSALLQQQRWAPPYLEIQGAWVQGRPRPWQHGVGLALGTGIAGDGGLIQGVEQVEQWSWTLSYEARARLDDTWQAGGKLGPAYVHWPGGRTWGVEGAVHVAHLLLAGTGVYAELGASWFAGAEDTGHTLFSAEAGVLFQLEWLP